MNSRLTVATKLAYATGNVGLIALAAASGFFLMIFYTDVAMVPPAVAGSALLIGKLWDVVNDPLFGYMSDRTRSRYGRRRVYLIFGALPLAVCAALLWFVPQGMSTTLAFIWIAATYMLFDTVFTIVQMPYATLAAEMTEDYDERTSLTAIASVGALIGYALGSILMPRIVAATGDARLGYLVAGGVLGAIVGLAVAFVAWRVKEPARDFVPPSTTPVVEFIGQVKGTLRNRPFVSLLTSAALARLGLTLMQTSLAYYAIYRMGMTKQDIPQVMTVLLGSVAVFVYVWKLVCDRWSKHLAYATGLTITAVTLLLFVYLKPVDPVLGKLAFCVVGLGLAAHWIAPFAMFPDTISTADEAGAAQPTGVYFGVSGLADKISRTLGSVSVGWILGWYGYVPNAAQSERALFAIDLVFGYLPAVILLLTVPLLARYPLDRKTYDARIAELQARPSPAE